VGKKILITTPDTSMLGGVAALYKNLNLETYPNVDYFFIQHNSDRLVRLKKILVYPAKFILFFWKCTQASTIVINVSFERNSILRDTLYFFIAKKIFRRRTIIFWHGWIEGFEEKVNESAFYKSILKRYFASADQTIILSNVFREKLIRLGYSINHNFCLSSVAADDSFIHSFQFQEKYNDMKVVRLLFLSRVISEKGIFKAIDIMDQLVNNKGFRNVQLVVAGDGADVVEAKNMVSNKRLDPYIEFLGLVEDYDKCRVLFNSHILIFPTSFCEGMPVSIIESMLFGLYIMASRKGGIIDIISEANGNLMDEDDCDIYVEKIVELLNNNNKIRKVGLYNHLYSVNNYTSSVVKKKLYTVFSSEPN
jgi:glycosyltransferase involved in cell wall biosynthesis